MTLDASLPSVPAVAKFEPQWNIPQVFGFLIADSLEFGGVEVNCVESETKLVDLVFSVPSPFISVTTAVGTIVYYDPDPFVVDGIDYSVVGRL